MISSFLLKFTFCFQNDQLYWNVYQDVEEKAIKYHLSEIILRCIANQLPWKTFYQTLPLAPFLNELLLNFHKNVSTSCIRFLIEMNWGLDSVQWSLKKLGKEDRRKKKKELTVLIYIYVKPCIFNLQTCTYTYIRKSMNRGNGHILTFHWWVIISDS